MGLFGGGSGADWLIAGLGNPEPKYDGTRHNTGFAALDALAEAWGCEINKSKWQGLYGIAQVDGRKVMLLKPLTYMNLSGQSIAPAAARYPLSTKNSCTPCAPTAAASPRPTFCPVCTPSTISAARIRSSSSATFLCFVIFLYSAPYCSII